MAHRKTLPRAGWIGLGAMGQPMARHLAAYGALAAVWNRSGEKAAALAADCGCRHVERLAELPAEVEVILTCVSADNDLETVIAQLLPELRPGQIIVDHSTVAPATVRRLAAEVAAHLGAMIDAPVSGGVEGAENGRLAVMAGGDAEVLEDVRPLLECYSAKITYLGPSGNGQAAKAVNQVLVAGIAEGVCEGLALAEALQLPREPLLEVLRGGAAGCWFLDKRGASMLDNRFTGGFKLALLHKDLEICARLAAAIGAELPTVQAALADYGQLLAEGRGDEEISALIRHKRQQIHGHGQTS